jgi:hypothetical protein
MRPEPHYVRSTDLPLISADGADGYAEVYRGDRCQAHCKELEQAEAKAKRDRVGMWAQGDSYENPAAFRWRWRLSDE